MNTLQYISSPLNYIGGKYKLLPQILPLFPKKINTFVDLFCGGCNVGINVRAEKVIFNDNLIYLIDLYKAFIENTEEDVLKFVENRIKEFQLSQTNEIGYKALRETYNKERNPLDLFVLTAYSFNHQIRFNNSHQFNNPFGRERSSFNASMHKKLISFIRTIKKRQVSFVCHNFDEFDFSILNENDFVYCDPPYLITSGTYNDGKRGFTGWSDIEEKKLLDILDHLNQKNIKFALSNVISHKGKQNDILHNWLLNREYHTFNLNKNYSNASYQTKNRDVDATREVLITNYFVEQPKTLFDFT